MNEKDLRAYQAKILADLRAKIANAPKPDPLRVPRTEFLINLAEQRLKRHLTQADLAEQTGLPQSVISRVESGEGNPSLRTLLSIVQALGAELVIQSSHGKNPDHF